LGLFLDFKIFGYVIMSLSKIENVINIKIKVKINSKIKISEEVTAKDG